jgi:O-antigen/teichoic acid export membrane protein
LIRRDYPPTTQELAAVSGFQLASAGAFAICVAAIAIPTGRTGQVAAIMVAALPILAFRSPGALTFERSLRYRPLVAIELVEVLVFNAWAIGTVAAGAGVWGMATAAVARSTAGAAMMTAASPIGFVRPSFKLAPLRPLLAFGAQFQAVGFVLVARSLVLNAGIAAIGGLRVLGIWAIADRFLSVLALVLESLWRVSFPMMSRLLAAGEDARGLVVRNVALVTCAIGMMAAALVGAGPALIDVLLGSRYSDAAAVLPWACLGLVLNVPAGVIVGGYLYAQGRAGAVLGAVVAHSLLWYAVGFPLIDSVGIQAIGIGSLVGSASSTVLLLRATTDIDTLCTVRACWKPVLSSALAGGAAWSAAHAMGSGVVAAGVGALTAVLLFILVLSALDRPLVHRARRLLMFAMRAAAGRPPSPSTAQP